MPPSCCFFLRVLNLELYSRERISESKRISNPGCYATSTQLLLAPLLPYLDPTAPPTVFGTSGYSGAGTKAGQLDPEGNYTTIPKVTPESLGGGVKAYSLTDHIHEREAAFHLSHLFPDSKRPVHDPIRNSEFKLAFVPNVGPWFSGIISVMSAPLKDKMRASEIKALYEHKYDGEELIKVQSDVVELKDVEGHHWWSVGGIQVHSSGKRVVVTVSARTTF